MAGTQQGLLQDPVGLLQTDCVAGLQKAARLQTAVCACLQQRECVAMGNCAAQKQAWLMQGKVGAQQLQAATAEAVKPGVFTCSEWQGEQQRRV